MYLWSLVVALVAATLVLTAYASTFAWSHLFELIAPEGELTTGVLAGLVLLVFQVIALTIAVDWSSERRKRPARKNAAEAIAQDAAYLIAMYRNIQIEFTGEKDGVYYKYVNPSKLRWMGINP